MKVINIYTDGSSRGNPGPGGFGVILQFGTQSKELSEGFRLTTNNRMELLAVIFALENLKTNKYPINIYSDSKYIIDSISKKWVFNWEKKNFKGKKNSDLWRRYLEIQAKFNLNFIWVKGHDGHPENEKCDQLAVEAAINHPKNRDIFFEEENKSEPS